MMDPGAVHCAAILIYIRGLHPSLNQGTTSICYLNDKQQLQQWRGDAEEEVDKPIQISIQQRHKAASHQSNEKRQVHWSKHTQWLPLGATSNRVNSISLPVCFTQEHRDQVRL